MSNKKTGDDATKNSGVEKQVLADKQELTLHRDHVLVERPHGYEVIADQQERVLQEIADACDAAGCRKVLIVGPGTKMGLSELEILELAKNIAAIDVQVAIAEQHDASSEAINLLEYGTYSHGGSLKYFEDIEDARAWLELD